MYPGALERVGTYPEYPDMNSTSGTMYPCTVAGCLVHLYSFPRRFASHDSYKIVCNTNITNNIHSGTYRDTKNRYTYPGSVIVLQLYSNCTIVWYPGTGYPEYAGQFECTTNSVHSGIWGPGYPVPGMHMHIYC